MDGGCVCCSTVDYTVNLQCRSDRTRVCAVVAVVVGCYVAIKVCVGIVSVRRSSSGRRSSN